MIGEERETEDGKEALLLRVGVVNPLRVVAFVLVGAAVLVIVIELCLELVGVADVIAFAVVLVWLELTTAVVAGRDTLLVPSMPVSLALLLLPLLLLVVLVVLWLLLLFFWSLLLVLVETAFRTAVC